MNQESILYDKDTIVEEELLNLCSRLTRIHAMASHPTHTVKVRIAEKNMLPRRVAKSSNNHEKPQKLNHHQQTQTSCRHQLVDCKHQLVDCRHQLVDQIYIYCRNRQQDTKNFIRTKSGGFRTITSIPWRYIGSKPQSIRRHHQYQLTLGQPSLHSCLNQIFNQQEKT